MNEESRLHPRQPIELPVVLIATSYLATRVSDAKSLDISEGGISLFTRQSLTDGQQVSVEFAQPHISQLIHLRAVVKHRQEDRYGMQFLSTTPEQAHYIRLMVGQA